MITKVNHFPIFFDKLCSEIMERTLIPLPGCSEIRMNRFFSLVGINVLYAQTY